MRSFGVSSLAFLASAVAAQGPLVQYGSFHDLGAGPQNEAGVPFLVGAGDCTPVMTAAFPVGPDGVGAFTTLWPGLAPGTPLYFQAPVLDPSAPEGVRFSNAVVGETAGSGIRDPEPWSSTDPVVRVVSTEPGRGVPRVEVRLLSDQVLRSETDEQGYSLFPRLQIPTGPSPDPNAPPGAKAEVIAKAQVYADGYLPQVKELTFREGETFNHLALVPESTGHTTPLISAAVGGTFELGAYLELVVPSGALSADARLLVVEVPPQAMSDVWAEWDLRYQAWVVAVDGDGNQIRDVVPSDYGAGIVLRASLPDQEERPNALESSWVARGLDPELESTVKGTASYDYTTETLDLPVVEGFNFGEFCYRELVDGCEVTGWELFYVEDSRSYDASVGVDFICGQYFGIASTSAEYGETWETNWDIEWGEAAEIGLEAGVILSKTSAKFHGHFRRGSGGAKIVNVLREEAVGTGDRPSPILGGGCISGSREYGLVKVAYTMYARCRHAHCPCIPPRRLGKIELIERLAGWVTASEWDSACEGCAEEGVIPPRLRKRAGS